MLALHHTDFSLAAGPSLIAEQGLWGAGASVIGAQGLSSAAPNGHGS